jgi:hypothetical protein
VTQTGGPTEDGIYELRSPTVHGTSSTTPCGIGVLMTLAPDQRARKLIAELSVQQQLGKSDSERADELRDLLDVEWAQLTEAQQQSLREYSEALYEGDS